MRLLIVGKCPPIQGGVAWLTWRTCVELARRGHEVHLLTNAAEVEPGYRQLFFGDDAEVASGQRAPGFQRHELTPIGSYNYLPESPEYGARLFGKGLAIAQATRPELIVGWYFQPYGLVAAQLARTLGLPLALFHAGSDLGLLPQHPDLSHALKHMAAAANVVFTIDGPPVREALARLDIPSERLRFLKGFQPLHESFHQPDLFPFEQLQQESPQQLATFPLDKDLIAALVANNEKPLDANRPTVAIFGKVGEGKGSFDLLAALSDLAHRAPSFNFVALMAGWDSALQRFAAMVVRDRPLAQCSWLFPTIAPWRVPAFLRRCDVVCALERAGGVSVHFPMAPLEVLCCAVCLLCSADIADKPLYQQLLRDGQTCVRVADPRDHSALAGKLEPLLESRELRECVARQGHVAAASFFDALQRKQACRHAFADALEDYWRESPHGVR